MLLIIFIINANSAFSQVRIIANNKVDSTYCINHYPHYDFDNEEYFVGGYAPEEVIDGRHKSLIDICILVQDATLDQFNTSASNSLLISMDVLVDNTGEVRAAVFPYTEDIAHDILKYAFCLLKREKYKPAFRRGKPITYTFNFVLRFPILDRD
jgi:hypothetical protein